jgi:outer membrane protein TolC
LKEKIAILNEQIKAQEQITELYELYFNQNKTTLKELLDQRLKLLELKAKLKETELELLKIVN